MVARRCPACSRPSRRVRGNPSVQRHRPDPRGNDLCEEDSGMKSNGKKSKAANGTASGATSHVQILTGDCREILTSLEAGTVQCCVTSPPYWGLRDYDHPAQIGAEPSPEDYVSNLVTVFREVRRVLRNDGTFWLNIGDGYARNGGTGNCGPNAIVGNTKKLIQRRSCKVPDCWGLKDRDLMGIPWAGCPCLASRWMDSALTNHLAEKDRHAGKRKESPDECDRRHFSFRKAIGVLLRFNRRPGRDRSQPTELLATWTRH